jgi:iron complex outermembrane receptor protein
MNYFLFSRARLSVAIALTCGSFAANAAETASLEKVIVSATRSETVQLPLATTITVIDEEQIRQSGATLVSEILRLQAGIQLQDVDGSGGRNVTIGMRGFTGNAANNTLVLVDGRRLNNASLASPALNTVSIKDIERIEIVQGSASVLYGDQAVGGVINIITRRPVSGELDGAVEILGGSDNLGSISANVSQGFANGLSYNLSAQKREADNFRDNNESDYENILANLRYDFSRGHVFVEAQIVDDKLNLPGSISDEQAQENPRQTNTPDDLGNQKTETWRMGGGFEFNEKWEILAEYADRHEETHAVYSASASDQVLEVKSFTPRLIGTLDLGAGKTIVTLGYDRNEAVYALASEWGVTDSEQDTHGYYAQVVTPLTRTLTATLGARYSDVADINNATNEKNRDSLHAQEFGLSYQFSESLRIFGRYAEGFRFANADENAYTPLDVDYLAPQTSDSFELGAAWSRADFIASFTAYDMEVNNEILFDALNFVNINLPKSQRRGVILDASLAVNERLSFRANYTYTDAELDAGAFTGNKVPFVAENTANTAVVFKPLEKVTATIDASYTGSRYLVGDDANAADKAGDVTVLNANLLWSITTDVDLGLRIKNITDKRYADYNALGWSGRAQYPQPGRTFSASVTYSF